MNLFYYFLGSFLFVVFHVIYNVFSVPDQSYTLTPVNLIREVIVGGLAGLAFFIVDYLMYKKK